MKKLLLLSISSAMMLIVCSCRALPVFHSSEKSISITACLSPKGGQGTLSLGIYFNPNDIYYEEISNTLQEAGMRCVFYGSLVNFEKYLAKPNPDLWAKIKKYIDAGHLIGIRVDTKILRSNSPEEIAQRIDKVRDGVLQKTGFCISVIRMIKFGDHALKTDLLLSSKYILEEETDYCHTISRDIPFPLDYRDMAEEATQREFWAKYNIYTIDKAFLKNMITDLQKRHVDVVPYPEMALYRRALYSASYDAARQIGTDRTLTITGICPEYPDIPICYRVRQYCGTNLIKEDRLFLQNHDSGQVVMEEKFNNIQSFPELQLTMLPHNAQASLVFTIDDTNMTQTKEWYPTIKKYGLVSTHFLNMEVLQKMIKNMLPDLRKMEQDGFEIGCHSYAHMVKGEMAKNMKGSRGVGALPDKLFEDDLHKALDVIKQNGLHCTAYCFPGNFHCYNARKSVKKYFPYSVWNERPHFSPKATEFVPDEYLDFLQQGHYNHVQMLHTPVYVGDKFLEAFEPLFAAMAQRPQIMNWTYSQMRAYLRGKAETEIILSYADAQKIRFRAGNPDNEKISGLLPMTCKLRMNANRIEQICSDDGKIIPWRTENDNILFDVERGKNIEIRLKGSPLPIR